MRNSVTPRDPAARTWTKPELLRLGRIEDVAGAESPLAQAAGNVKS
ncbi:MAG: hypothetical protein LC648_09470 [Novosphingobium sp.]|nr:hypothetical protein [Novosphingobium sp.]